MDACKWRFLSPVVYLSLEKKYVCVNDIKLVIEAVYVHAIVNIKSRPEKR